MDSLGLAARRQLRFVKERDDNATGVSRQECPLTLRIRLIRLSGEGLAIVRMSWTSVDDGRPEKSGVRGYVEGSIQSTYV